MDLPLRYWLVASVATTESPGFPLFVSLTGISDEILPLLAARVRVGGWGGGGDWRTFSQIKHWHQREQ